LSETNNTLDGTKNELDMIKQELKAVQGELATGYNVIKQKSARISHLEQSLGDAKSSVLHLIQEHERMQANMERQKESLGIFISQQIGAEKDAKTSLLKMSLLVDAIDVSQRVSALEADLEQVVAAAEDAKIDVKEVNEERLGLAAEGQ